MVKKICVNTVNSETTDSKWDRIEKELKQYSSSSARELIDQIYPSISSNSSPGMTGKNRSLEGEYLCRLPSQAMDFSLSLLEICELVIEMVFGIHVYEVLLMPTAIFFWFFFIFSSSWSLVRLAIRRSMMLGGGGLIEPCNSTKWRNSFFVKLFFWIRSSITTSMSFLFSCKIYKIQETRRLKCRIISMKKFCMIVRLNFLEKLWYLFCTLITNV